MDKQWFKPPPPSRPSILPSAVAMLFAAVIVVRIFSAKVDPIDARAAAASTSSIPARPDGSTMFSGFDDTYEYLCNEAGAPVVPSKLSIVANLPFDGFMYLALIL